MGVAGGDDLIEQVGSLLVQGKIPELVNQKQRGLGVEL
jgi:hypothetical protein